MTKQVKYIASTFVFLRAICLVHTLIVYTGEQTVLDCNLTEALPKWRKAIQNNSYDLYSNQDSKTINPSLPHKDRLSISDEGSLVIKDTERRDAGNYTCSYSGLGQEWIELIVMVKPQLPAIINTETNGSGRAIIRGTEDENITLTCISSGGYPEPSVVWRTSFTELPSTKTVVTATDGTYNVTIRHLLTAKRYNDRVTYICKSALNSQESLMSSVMLYLSLKPSQPEIKGSDTIAENSIGHFQCKTKGCRPEATIVWRYNGSSHSIPVNSSYNSTSETYKVESDYSTGTLRRIDNEKQLVCVVSHEALPGDIQQSHTLNITFSPVSVTLSGNDQIVANGVNTLELTCIATTANPAAILRWRNGQTDIRSDITRSTRDGDYGGKVVTEKLTLRPTRYMDGDIISCVFNTNVKDQTTLNLTYNPVATIQGPSSITVPEGVKNLSFICSAESKPVSIFTWYHNGNMVRKSNGQQATNKYTYALPEVERKHFGNYTCEADNNVNPKTTDVVSLFILFSPISVTLSGNAQIVANGTNPLELTCTAGTANPAAILQWWQGQTNISSGISRSTWPGDYGGKEVTEKLTILPTRYMDGVIISCSFNTEVKDKTTLNLNYNPIISVPKHVNATEGEPQVTIRCSAESKPPSSFKWLKNEQAVHVGIGSTDNNILDYVIPVVKRSDAGLYRCEAENGIGRPDTNNSVSELHVNYPPDVSVHTNNATVNDTVVNLTCLASGIPPKYSYTEWTQTWPGQGMTLKTYPSGRHLTLTNLSYENTGMYHCAASNGVKKWNTATQFIEGSAYMFVRSFPIITFPELQDNRTHKVPAALNKNFTVKIKLYSNDDMASQLNISMLDNSSVTVNDSVTEMIESDITLKIHGQSVRSRGMHLNVTHTVSTEKEFGMYFITITNNIGAAVVPFEVIPIGPPCSPADAVVESITQNTILISWVRCFHGGFPQTFVVQYRSDETDWTNETDIYGGLSRASDRLNATVYSLQPGTRYYIRLYSYNEEGMSNYTNLEANTQSKGSSEETPIGLIAGGVVGGLAAAALIIIIVLFLLKYKRTQQSPSKCLLKDNERPGVTNGADDTPEINLNPMYESAGPLPSTSNNSEVYSQVDRNRKKANPAGDIYSQVNKPKKRPLAGGPEVKNDVYAKVQKKSLKEKDAGKVKHKKQKADKKAKKGKQTEGDIYDNVDSSVAKGDTVYENPSCSIEDEHPKQMRNQDGLIYADLDLPKETFGKDRKAVIHGLDDRTDYADIKYGEVGEQAPESDEEKKQE